MNLISLILFLNSKDSKSISGTLEAYLCYLAYWSLKNDGVPSKLKHF